MQFDDVILGRRSIRGYKPDPVPRALIEEILTLAMRAPSSMNTQPWNFYVLTGEPLDRIRAGNTERNIAGVPHSREFRTGTSQSSAPWKIQMGLPARRRAISFGRSLSGKAAKGPPFEAAPRTPPQIGTSAAKRSGTSAPRNQVP